MARSLRTLTSFCLSALLIAISASPATADLPPLYKIWGYATDAIGRPLLGVSVTGQSVSTLTDDLGRFELPQRVVGTFALTASRADLETKRSEVQVLLPVDTRHDFAGMLYRLTPSISREHISTASGDTSLKVELESWAPSPGWTGGFGHSCVKVSDSRTGGVFDARLIGNNPDGSSLWDLQLPLEGSSPEGSFNLVARAVVCDSNTLLTEERSVSYVIDNTPPEILDLSPRDGHNTLFAKQPLEAKVLDRGPSGIAPDGVSFVMEDESTLISDNLSFEAKYDADSGIATSASEAALLDGHDYRITVRASDRAGNQVSWGHVPYKGSEDPRSGGFRKVTLSATAASSTILPITCPVTAQDGIATCSDVLIGLSNGSARLSSSRHSFSTAYIVHSVTLRDAVIEYQLLGQTLTANAYNQRIAAGNEWEPRASEFKYQVGDRTSLPSVFTAYPLDRSLEVGTLRIALPPEFAGAQSVTLRMNSITEYMDSSADVVATGACKTALTDASPCVTDPVWSRYAVVFKSTVQDRAAAIERHRALGAEIVKIYESDSIRAYEASLPPSVRGAISSSDEVERLIPARSPNLEDEYFNLLDLPAASPLTGGEYLSWEHEETHVVQEIPLSPTQPARITSQEAFQQSDEGTFLGPTTHALEISPNVTANADTPERATANKRARYEATDGSYWLEAQPVGDTGIRYMVRLENSSAPNSFTFNLELPSGTVIAQTSSDTAVVIREMHGSEEMPIGVFRTPIAYDADGQPVAIRQYIESNQVRIEIDLGGNPKFPIIADPTYQAIVCVSSHTAGTASSFLRDTGACPYGITFVWARNFWPKKAKVHDDGTYRQLREDGSCTIVNDTGWAWDFRTSCQMHDYGYDLIRVRTPFAYLGVIKEDVDREFRDAMYEHCSHRSLLLQPDCYIRGTEYWLGVFLIPGMPFDGRQHPTNGWPNYANFIENPYFYGGTYAWGLLAKPGGSANWATYWDPTGTPVMMLEWNCAGTVPDCSVYQDIRDNLKGRFKGGELIEAVGQLRCNASSGQCNYTNALWGERPNGQMVLLQAKDWHVPTGLAPWWDFQILYRIPLNTEYVRLRFEIYNRDSGRNLDLRYPVVRLLDQWY